MWEEDRLLLKDQGYLIVVILDNILIYINNSIIEAIETIEYIIYYLSLYSLDYNSIKLIFLIFISLILL